MLNNIPLTAIVTTLLFLVMFGAWLFVGYRMSKTAGAVQPPVRFMHKFFLYMAIFAAFMSAPYLWLPVSASGFSEAQAWGYVVGHIFFYVAMMYVARMVCAMVPKLANKDRLVTWVWLAYGAVFTVLNAKTMIWGTQPIFDHARNLTEYNANPIVGKGIVLIALFSLVPAVVLFTRNAIKARGATRTKSQLLAAGFLLMVVGGPMHDVARTGTAYALADALTIICILVLGAGVAYRLEQGLAPAPARPVLAPSSNTV